MSFDGSRTFREETAEIALSHESQPDELPKLGVRPKDTKPYIPFLESHNYNVFAERDTNELWDPNVP